MSTRKHRAARVNFWQRCRNCGERRVRHFDPWTKTYTCQPTSLWNDLQERNPHKPLEE